MAYCNGGLVAGMQELYRGAGLPHDSLVASLLKESGDVRSTVRYDQNMRHLSR